MKCDVAIIGGGLAGLSLSIDLRKRGFSVVVIEKGNYPRHKVCGEYISMEGDYVDHPVHGPSLPFSISVQLTYHHQL